MAASALDFVPIGANAETLPANLTEGRFRHFWEQTDKSRGAALAVARSTRLSMPASCSVEIVTQSASGIVFAMVRNWCGCKFAVRTVGDRRRALLFNSSERRQFDSGRTIANQLLEFSWLALP